MNRFITFEGGEGAGKTTQIRMLVDYLEAHKIPVVQTREPGGTEGAEAIRDLLVNGSKDRWDPICETSLFLTARRQHVQALIEPAMKSGKTVICDRFVDSTLVYQGIGKKLGTEYVKKLGLMIVGHVMPDITFLLDIDPEIGLKRAGDRKGTETRFESYDVDFHQSIRNGFLAIAKAEPKRVKVLDATIDPEELHKKIIAHLDISAPKKK